SMNAELLRRIPLFDSLTDPELAELAKYLRREEAPPHRAVFWMHEQSHDLYIIAEGEVQIFYTEDGGGEVPLARLGPGSFFGELSLIDGGPHSAHARTVTDCTIYRLDRASFYHFLETHPQLALTLLKVLSLRLRRATLQQRTVQNPNEQINAGRSRFQQAIDALARVFTSGAFLVCYVLFVTLWIVGQSLEWRHIHGAPVHYTDQPPTFFFLGFIVTLFSSLLTVFILNSQRRQAKSDRIRAEIEYQVNLKAQSEVLKLQQKMDEVLDRLR
ncbi:MAG: cyclic nucleotide-binding domain-containing protein, partial [Chitinophagaceae bacterium]